MIGSEEKIRQLLEENSRLTKRIQELEQAVASQKRVEDALAASEAKFKAIVDSLPLAIYLATGIAQVTEYMNPAMVRMFGYSMADIPNIAEWLPRAYPDESYRRQVFEEWTRRVKCAIETRLPIEPMEVVCTCKDGSKKVISWGFITLGEKNYSFGLDLTQRKNAEEALSESEARYRALVENIPQKVFTKDLTFTYTSVNENFAKDLGLRPEEMIGKTDADFFPPEIAAKYRSDDSRIIATRETAELEEKYILNGQETWVRTVKAPLIDADGNIAGVCGVFWDITERKRVEDALRSSEAQKKAILDGITTNIALVDTKLNVLWVNKAAAQSVQKSPEEMVGLPCYSFWGDSRKPCTNCPSLKALQTKRSEHIIVHSPNGKVWDEGGEPVFDSEGNVVAVVEIAQDITERKQVESALAEEKERLAVTLRSIGDGVITTDVHGKVIIMNRIAEQLTGWSQAEACGQPLSNVFHIVDEVTRRPCGNPAERVLATDEIIELANHTLLISRDGNERIIADSGAPIRDRNGVTIGVVLVFRDMTEKQKLLDALQRSDKLDSLGILAGGIAHDFNNMLAGIFGYIDLARQVSSDADVSRYLESAMTVFGRAKDLTQQLLTFSKGGTPKRITGELGDLIRESASFALSGSQIACDFFIPDDLWLADFDKNQIGQVIDNLVLNAQQAMPLGGRISITTRNVTLKDGEHPPLKGGRFIQISVVDAGIGIPPDLLKRIFDPFFTTKQKGNGLGLATCYAIIQKHDGGIEVESVMGKGSTFHLFLPASQGKTSPTVAQAPVEHTGHGRMLIMDDEPYIRDILGTILREMGYSILEAKNGEEALALCADAAEKGTSIEGAFFDLTIPGSMGGKEAIGLLRRIFPDVPVYASSGYSEDPVMACPTEYGFTDSIRKPYRKQELAVMLNRNAPKRPPESLKE